MSPKNTKASVRKITGKIVDRLVSDPKFREQMAADPDNALKKAGFYAELRKSTGTVLPKACHFQTCIQKTCNATCRKVTCKDGITEKAIVQTP